MMTMPLAVILPFIFCGMTLAGCEERTSAAQAPGETRVALATGRLMDAGVMQRARAAHTATSLVDGRVLLVGGMKAGGGAVAGAELYDPASGAFTSAGPMLTERHSHTATRLPDGRVLVVGGYDASNTVLASAELYDPVTGNFADAGSMVTSRSGHVAVLLQDGRVLFVGGLGTGWSFLSSVEIYDPRTKSFAATGAMTVPRASHAAVALQDGRVLVMGGHNGRRTSMRLHASAEIYDPSTARFTSTGDMEVSRHKHDAVTLADGRVLVSGGADERDSRGVYKSAEIYNPATGAFAPTGDMGLTRYKHQGTSVPLNDGLVFLAGGAAQAELYDPRAGTFTLVGGEARIAGLFSTSARLPDGSVLISGGYSADDLNPVRSTWVYRR